MNSEINIDQSQNNSLQKSIEINKIPNSFSNPEEVKKLIENLLKKRLNKRLLKLETNEKEGQKNLKFTFLKFKEFDKILDSFKEQIKKSKEDSKKEKDESKKIKEIGKSHISKSQAPQKKLKIITGDFLTNRTIVNNKDKYKINNIKNINKSNYQTELPKKEHVRPKTFKGHKIKEKSKLKVGPLSIDKINNMSSPVRPEENISKTIVSMSTNKKEKNIHNSVLYNREQAMKKGIKKNQQTNLTKAFSDLGTEIKKSSHFTEKNDKKSKNIIKDKDKIESKTQRKKGNDKKTIIKKTNEKIKKNPVKKNKKGEEEEVKEENKNKQEVKKNEEGKIEEDKKEEDKKIEEKREEKKEEEIKKTEDINNENKEKDEIIIKKNEKEEENIENKENHNTEDINQQKDELINKEEKKEEKEEKEEKEIIPKTESNNKTENVDKIEDKNDKEDAENKNISDNLKDNNENFKKEEEKIIQIPKEEDKGKDNIIIQEDEKKENIKKDSDKNVENIITQNDAKKDLNQLPTDNKNQEVKEEKELEENIIQDNTAIPLSAPEKKEEEKYIQQEKIKNEEPKSPSDILNEQSKTNNDKIESLNEEKETNINDNNKSPSENNPNLIETIRKDNEEMKKVNEEELLKHYQSQFIDINLNQSINQNMSFSQSFLQSRSFLEDKPTEKIARDPNTPLTKDEIIKKYKNYFIYVFDFLEFKERIQFSGIHRGFKNERIYLFNSKREEAISSLELKERETLDDRINKFKLNFKSDVYKKPLDKFNPGKSSVNAVISLDKDMFSKLFKQKVLDIKLSDIYIVYRVLFALMGETKIAEIVDDNEFWEKCIEYLNNNGKNKIGSFIFEKSKSFDFSHKNIYTLNKLLVGIKPKLNPGSFSKISGTTGLLIFIVRDALEFAGVLITNKTPKSRIYDNLMYYKNLIEPLTNFIDFLSKIKK